jgi:hypothetical protein
LNRIRWLEYKRAIWKKQYAKSLATEITHLPSHSLRSPALQQTQCGASVGDDVAGGARGEKKRTASSTSWQLSLDISTCWLVSPWKRLINNVA